MHRFINFRQPPTKVLVTVLALGVWVLAIEQFVPSIFGQARAATSSVRSKTLDTLNVHRINIKDADGTTRFVISNAQDSPPAVVRGKTYKRSISNSAGMIFYKPNGDETGGIATSVIHNRNQAALIFDYTHQPTDGISMGTLESSDGKKWSAGFSVHDRRPYHPGPIKSSGGVKRIWLGDNNHDTELIIYGPKGNARIRIGVGKDGNPHIEMLNEKGKVTYNAMGNHG
jgi:hypothetical protein